MARSAVRPRRRSRWHPRLRRLGIALAVVAGLLLGLVLLFRHGVGLDLERFRLRIEAALSEQLGAPVRIGEARVRIAPWPVLWLREAKIGAVDEEWLRVEQAEGSLALFPLLRKGELRVSRLELAGVTLDLTRPAPRRGGETSAAPESAAEPVRLVEVRELLLEAVEVVLPSGSEPPSERRVSVSRLALEGAEGRPVSLVISGGYRGPHAAFVGIEGAGEGGSLLEGQGEGPWPYRLLLRGSGLELELEGDVPGLADAGAPARDTAAPPFTLRGRLRAEKLSELLEALAVPGFRPGSGAFMEPAELDFDGRWGGGRLEAALQATLAGDVISAELRLDEEAGRSLLRGTLDSAELSLSPWLAAEEGAAEPAAKPPDWRSFDLAPIAATLADIGLDLELAAHVGALHHDGVALGDVELGVDWRRGQITVPFSAVVRPRGSSGSDGVGGEGVKLDVGTSGGGSPVAGQVTLVTGSEPGATLRATLEDVALARWWREATAGDRIDRVEASLSTRGSTLGQWVQNARGEARALGLAFENLRARSDLSPVSLRVETLEARLGAELTLRGRAAMVDRELVAEAVTSSVFTLLGRPDSVPLRLEIDDAGSRLAARGRIATRPGVGSQIEIEVDVERLGALASWIGVSEEREKPAAAHVRITGDGAGEWSVDAPAVRIGRSHGTVSARWHGGDRRLSARASLPLLDLEEWSSGRPPATGGSIASDRDSSDPDTGDPGSVDSGPVDSGSGALAHWRDLPLVPAAIADWRIALDLEIESVDRIGTDLSALAAHLELGDGEITSSSVEFELAGAPFRGEWSLDRQAEVPQIRVVADSRDLDLGEILAQEGIAENLDLAVQRVSWEGTARGETLGELTDSSRSRFQLENAEYWLVDGAGARRESIRLTRAVAEATSQERVEVQGEAVFRETPIGVELAISAASEARESGRAPLDLRLSVEGARVHLFGEASLEDETVGMDLEVSGQRFDALSSLLEVELPRGRPFSLATRIEAGSSVGEHRQDEAARWRSWKFSDIVFEWGESQVEGALELELEPERPRLSGRLGASRLRVVDLLPEASAEATSTPSTEPAVVTDEKTRAAETAEAKEPARSEDLPEPFVLERDPLPAIDVDLVLDSPDLVLPDGANAEAKGRVVLDSTGLEVRLDSLVARGGAGEGLFRLEPGETGAKLSLAARIEGFDYSALADRFERYRGEEGRVGFYLDLVSEAPWGQPVVAGIDGEVGLLLQPTHLESLTIDLWAADLATSLIPQLGWADSPSTVNCVALYANLDDGLAEQVRVILDTQRVRVAGRGEVDLGDRTIDLKLKPKPKRLALLSLATPVRIRGRGADLDVRVTSSGVVWMGVKASLYVYTLATQLLQRPLPADGTEACIALFEGRIEKEKWRPGRYASQPDELLDAVRGAGGKAPP